MLRHRTSSRQAAFLSLACLVLALATVAAARVPSAQAPVARVVAVGDIHGAADEFVAILQAAQLLGADGKWSGGTSTFVQTGDFLDRGAGIRQVLDLLMGLETQARAAGGRVEVLLGNHEIMNMLRDVVDVSPEAFASFADEKSDERLRKAYDAAREIAKRAGGIDPGSQDAWMSAHPPGYLEYLEAMGPRGRYGKWLRAHKAVAQIDRTAFMHAGIAPAHRGDLEDVNREVARALRAWDDASAMMVRERLIAPWFTLKETVSAAVIELRSVSAALEAGRPVGDRVTRQYIDQLRAIVGIGDSPLLAPAGPMWFRGLSSPAGEQTDEQVTTLFSRLGVTRMVVGHTPRLPGRITPRFGNRVFPIDTGMLTSFFKGGRASALEIAGNRVMAIYEGEREVLVER